MLPFGEQILYLHMFDDYTCLVFSQGKTGPVQGPVNITSVNIYHSRGDSAHTIGFPGVFSEEHYAVFRSGTSEQKRSLLFDMTTVGGVLILRSRLEQSRGVVMAYV